MRWEIYRKSVALLISLRNSCHYPQVLADDYRERVSHEWREGLSSISSKFGFAELPLYFSITDKLHPNSEIIPKFIRKGLFI